MIIPLARRSGPKLIRAVFLLGAGCLAAAAHADRKPAPAAPNPDLVAVKDSIGALAKGPIHDLADGQAATNARLDELQATLARAARGFQGVDLSQMSKDASATRGAVAGLLTDQAGVARQVSGVDSRLQAVADDAAGLRKDLTHAFSTQDERLSRWQQEAVEAGQRAQRESGAAAAAALMAQGMRIDSGFRLLWIGLAVAGCALLGALFWQALSRRRAHREVLLTLARIGADLRHNGGPRAPAAPALDCGKIEEVERRLRILTDRWEALASWLPAEPTPLATAARAVPRVSANGVHLRRPAPESGGFATATATGDKPTVSVEGLTEPSIASRLLWPPEFLDPESPLSRWRFLLESHFEDEGRPALPVLGCLLGLRGLIARPGAGPAEIATAAFRLSESLYTYWQSLPELSPDDCQQASGAWLQSVRSLIAAAAPRLEVREVLPDARIDLDVMHPVREGSGNHLNVADVFSWAVLDRSAGERPRVLHRALVASS